MTCFYTVTSYIHLYTSIYLLRSNLFCVLTSWKSLFQSSGSGAPGPKSWCLRCLWILRRSRQVVNLWELWRHAIYLIWGSVWSELLNLYELFIMDFKNWWKRHLRTETQRMKGMKRYERIWKDMKDYEWIWKDMKGYEWIWKDMKGYEWIWKAMNGYERIGKTMNECERIWTTMNGYERIWKTVNGCERIWKAMNEYERIWKTMNGYERIWTTMNGYERIGKAMNECERI